MTVIYEDNELLIKKKNKKEFVFFIKHWDGKYKKFWVNFPLSLIKLIAKKTEGNTKEYNCTLENKLATHRIFFSGAERNPRKTEKGIFASTDTIEDELHELLDK